MIKDDLIVFCIGPRGATFGQAKQIAKAPQGENPPTMIMMKHPFSYFKKEHLISIKNGDNYFEVPVIINGQRVENKVIRVYPYDWEQKSLQGWIPKNIIFQNEQMKETIKLQNAKINSYEKDLFDSNSQNRQLKRQLETAQHNLEMARTYSPPIIRREEGGSRHGRREED